jgi:hypothetical protein
MSIFTVTNDYEDLTGELSIHKNILETEVFKVEKENPFKSMTTYKNENGQWSCGNFGYYILNSYNKTKLNEISKLSEDQLRTLILDNFKASNIEVK